VGKAGLSDAFMTPQSYPNIRLGKCPAETLDPIRSEGQAAHPGNLLGETPCGRRRGRSAQSRPHPGRERSAPGAHVLDGNMRIAFRTADENGVPPSEPAVFVRLQEDR